MTDWTRRQLLAALPGGFLAAGFPRFARGNRGAGVGPGHPDPRPGIDASRVLTTDQLAVPSAGPVFDLVRQIPQVVDGIRCYCGCADLPGNYSLLSCYEAGGMAQHCMVCQGQGRLVHRLHRDGWSLDGIRAAVDASFGSS